MHQRLLIALAVAGLVAACVPAEPIVSDYNGDSVKIQTSNMADPEQVKATSTAEAGRICAKGGKRPEYASTRALPDGYTNEHLFLCL